MTAYRNDFYATRPIKTKKGKWKVNIYYEGKLFSSPDFYSKEVAMSIMRDRDNWDRLCKRVPPRKSVPVQIEMSLSA
jgi:hypothetical protein